MHRKRFSTSRYNSYRSAAVHRSVPQPKTILTYRGLGHLCTSQLNAAAEAALGSRTFLPLFAWNVNIQQPLLGSTALFGSFMYPRPPLTCYHLPISQHPLVFMMHRTNMLLVFRFLLATHLTIAQPQFSPRGDIENRYGSSLQKRITCEPARPDVSEDAVRIDTSAIACLTNSQRHRSLRMLATRTHRTTSTTASILCAFQADQIFAPTALTLGNLRVQYAQASASATCARFYTLYNSCLVSNNYAESACADDRAGYVYCANYT